MPCHHPFLFSSLRMLPFLSYGVMGTDFLVSVLTPAQFLITSGYVIELLLVKMMGTRALNKWSIIMDQGI